MENLRGINKPIAGADVNDSKFRGTFSLIGGYLSLSILYYAFFFFVALTVQRLRSALCLPNETRAPKVRHRDGIATDVHSGKLASSDCRPARLLRTR